TVMLEEAKNAGIADRDELSKLSVDRQKHFQTMAATKIALKKNDVVIVDTHAFINTSEGFYPGLPIHVIEHLKPTNFISISARPEEIYNRRMKDTSRNRDVISLASIKKELAVQDAMLSSCSVLSGSPMKPVLNREGKIDEAAMKVIKAMGI
ncbi:MAG: AAA family ATPase, partial [Nitrosopumilaceae archaeon]